MENLEVFRYQDSQVRVVKDEEGEPWWVAKDVADILGYANGSRDVQRHCKHAKTLNSTETVELTDSPRGILVIPESDLYRLIMRSGMEEAERFQDWVAEEVLPSIRKHGLYATPDTVEAILNDPDVMIKVLVALKDERAKRAALETERAALIPKAEFFDAVADSKDAVDMGRVAKVLNCGIGRNRLFALLWDKGILMSNNIPYQAMVDRGYFRVVEQKWTKPDGSTHVSFKPIVYQRGIEHIRKIVQSVKHHS